ncbi:MAG: hypothetical protein M8364_18605, partial [Methylobacter sp.]|uniref:hypothetical protein n=1 Tax=Methylobacter sp. TaxID=2051955 RepID=UPI00258D6D89
MPRQAPALLTAVGYEAVKELVKNVIKKPYSPRRTRRLSNSITCKYFIMIDVTHGRFHPVCRAEHRSF